MGRAIAIGDIHGCRLALDALLQEIKPQTEDLVVTLGDYVDRGEDSKGVLDRLIELKGECQLVPIRGNHEDMMLEVLEGAPPHNWLRFGGVDTLESYGFDGDLGVVPEDHRQFLKELVDWHEMEKWFFVHANYEPDLPLGQQEPDVLRWVSLFQMLPRPHMSGKKAVVGHTASRDGEVFDIGHLICLDTHVYGNGWLTAMEMDTGQLWQADRNGKLRLP
jgi:serine/threonine protein phosphatase 1